MGTNMVKSRSTMIEKIFTADIQLLENLSNFMNEKYGAGARLLKRAEERKIRVTE